MIKFKSCKWKNFLSTGNDAIEIRLDKSPTTLIVGQNGAGKTTTINLFLGLISPTEGKAFINGVEVEPNAKTRQMIAYIPEVVQLYGNMNGLENIRFFSQLAGFDYSTAQLEVLLLKAGLKKEEFLKILENNIYSDLDNIN